MAPLIDRVRTTLEQRGTACPLEEVMDLCPDLTWNQVFLAVDHLSRTGEVRVTLDSGKIYSVQAYRSMGCESSPVSPADSQTYTREPRMS